MENNKPIQIVISIGLGLFILYLVVKLVIKDVKKSKEKQDIKEEKQSELFNDFKVYSTPEGLSKIAATYKRETGKEVKQGAKLSAMTSDQQGIAATNIHYAKGFFNDDENKLYNGIRAIKTGFDLLAISIQFTKSFGVNMFTFIEGFTNEEEQQKIAEILSKKPVYLGSKTALDGSKLK